MAKRNVPTLWIEQIKVDASGGFCVTEIRVGLDPWGDPLSEDRSPSVGVKTLKVRVQRGSGEVRLPSQYMPYSVEVATDGSATLGEIDAMLPTMRKLSAALAKIDTECGAPKRNADVARRVVSALKVQYGYRRARGGDPWTQERCDAVDMIYKASQEEAAWEEKTTASAMAV